MLSPVGPLPPATAPASALAQGLHGGAQPGWGPGGKGGGKKGGGGGGGGGEGAVLRCRDPIIWRSFLEKLQTGEAEVRSDKTTG